MKSSALYVMIALSGLVFGAEIVSSHLTKSLVLLISSYHMLYNILSLILLVISHKQMSKGKTLNNTFGWARVKILGMVVNMLGLSALCFSAFVEAIQTIVHASHEDTEPRYPLLIICLGIVNFCLNILCFFLIGGYTHHQGCYLIIQDVQVSYVITDDDKGDALSSSFQLNPTQHVEDGDLRQPDELLDSPAINDHRVVDISRDISSCLPVIVCGAVVYLMDGLLLKYVDSMLSFASVIVLIVTTYPFIRESSLILLQSIPKYIDVNGLTTRMLKQFPAVENVHDLHIWRLTTSEVIATVHIMLKSPFIYTSIADQLIQFFKKEGIGLVTIQPEFSEQEAFLDSRTECILKCSDNNNCGALTCCGHLQSEEKQEVRHRPVTNKEMEQNGSSVRLDLSVATDKNLFNNPSENSQDCDLPLLPKYDFGRIPVATETNV